MKFPELTLDNVRSVLDQNFLLASSFTADRAKKKRLCFCPATSEITIQYDGDHYYRNFNIIKTNGRLFVPEIERAIEMYNDL